MILKTNQEIRLTGEIYGVIYELQELSNHSLNPDEVREFLSDFIDAALEQYEDEIEDYENPAAEVDWENFKAISV